MLFFVWEEYHWPMLLPEIWNTPITKTAMVTDLQIISVLCRSVFVLYLMWSIYLNIDVCNIQSLPYLTFIPNQSTFLFRLSDCLKLKQLSGTYQPNLSEVTRVKQIFRRFPRQFTVFTFASRLISRPKWTEPENGIV